MIEVDGYRLLTDPTFDPPSDYELAYARLTKTGQPAIDRDQIGAIGPLLCLVISNIWTISIAPPELFLQRGCAF